MCQEGEKHSDKIILDALQQVTDSKIIPMRYEDGDFFLLDQRKLPHKTQWIHIRCASQGAKAIKNMVVRGAPAIGITGAFCVLLAARSLSRQRRESFDKNLKIKCQMIANARPTAVNLNWAIKRMLSVLVNNPQLTVDDIIYLFEKEALSIWKEDVDANLTMGRLAQTLFPDPVTILTHCNAGALATGGYGTALGVIRGIKDAGKTVKVFADETRPWLQGARLTAWELKQDSIECCLIVDSLAAFAMKKGLINAVVVGADRIAANGDVANKIGTYSVAIAAKANNIPFYVAAPVSTLDPATSSGDKIPIEKRPSEEITNIGKRAIAADVEALNLAFDITPHDLITAIITEKGVLRPPFGPAISHVCRT